jgi:glycosyltransferase involved in cell wall biosynthesis
MSKWLADSFIRDFGVPVRKLCPIYAGINMPDVGTPPAREHGRNGILFVGKQFDRKGGRVLLDAFERVRRAVPSATLTIVGPRLGVLGPGIKNPGFLSKQNPDGFAAMKRLYSDATVFVLPTLYEPFGISYVEAMAHGLPCIGTNICAVPEIVEDGNTGRLVAPGDAESLAGALIDLLMDPDKARAYGDAGFRKYRQQFTWAKVAERVEERTRDLCR